MPREIFVFLGIFVVGDSARSMILHLELQRDKRCRKQ